MIDKNNIAEVLKYNGVEEWDANNSNGWIKHTGLSNYIRFKYLDIDLDHPNLIPIIEAHYGKKLEPLPEPNPLIGKWVKCIMDSEFCTGNTWYMVNDKEIINDRIFVCNPDKHTSFILSKDYFNLTDIRDYNPDEEIVLKVGDKI